MDYDISQSQEFFQNPVYSVASTVIAIIMIIGLWKIFTKAGEEGWKAIIPLYNAYTLVKIIDGNGLKFLILFIPIVGAIYGIILAFREAKAFGKGTGFGFGLLFFPYIFTLILGFGDAQYIGPQKK